MSDVIKDLTGLDDRKGDSKSGGGGGEGGDFNEDQTTDGELPLLLAFSDADFAVQFASGAAVLALIDGRWCNATVVSR